MSRKPRLTVRRAEEALRAAGGIKTIAARMLKCHRATLYRFLQRHPTLAQIANEIDEEIKDLAETKLIQAIRDGDMPTVRWYLETKAKDRGYTRRVENTGPDGGPIETKRVAPDLSDLTEEELEILLRAAERRENASPVSHPQAVHQKAA
ncbi:helix-turn-helix domain-containing protein [Chelativorans alearense]|uniref:helix-turn-helix domain-containing protein n=1 Tax=Chelativorans alearense TaxID=2681495 RepID=UPI001969B35C|nr:helix-turn-helix domain-containing protein [Chelativorans alearense]